MNGSQTGVAMFGAIIVSMMVLGQIGSPEPIAGGAGWVGAGLLGLVLGWLLLIHLPSKDKQMMQLIQDCDTHNEKQRKEHLEEQKEARLKFDSTLRFVAEQHTEQVKELLKERYNRQQGPWKEVPPTT